MKKCSKCKKLLDASDFTKNKAMKDGLDHYCKKCKKSHNAVMYLITDREKYKGKYSERAALRRFENKVSRSEYNKMWRQNNKDKCNSYAAKRRAAKKSACVKFANLEKILEFYTKATKLTKQTNILHVVDHIIPLTHPLVCGLHIETNLRVITDSENSHKWNKFTPRIFCSYV